MSDTSDYAVAMDPDAESHRVEFTCPRSRRRYTIWLEDWQSIQAHMFAATLAKDKLAAEKK